MDGFVSFLAPDNLDPIDDEGDFELFNSQVDDLIHAWLRRYIEIYEPDYVFDEVVDNIGAIRISDESIMFQLLNPYTDKYEDFSFWIHILEDIKQETRRMVERTFYDSEYIADKIVSITPEIIAIIRSWFPYIVAEKIIGVRMHVSGRRDIWKSEKYERHDYLKVSYYWEDGKVWNKQLPMLHKGEYQGTKRGIVHMIGMERGKIMWLLTQKNRLTK